MLLAASSRNLRITDSILFRCVDNLNVTVNVGASCLGWNDLDSCLGDSRCNVVHTNYVNVLLRLGASIGKFQPFGFLEGKASICEASTSKLKGFSITN
jgi:hypothetical protein